MCDIRNCLRLGKHHKINFKGKIFEVCEFHFDIDLKPYEVKTE